MTKTSENTLYLVDGTYNIFRAFHARGVPEMRSSGGTPTKAVYIFTRMLAALLEGEKPAWLGVAFDLEGPTMRHEEYDRYVEEHPDEAAGMVGYKGTRDVTPEDLIAQIPWVKRVCDGFGVPVLELEGYEADDIIGTLARQAKERGLKVVIVTADKDLFQLVNDSVVILNPHKDNLVMDPGEVEKVFGVRPDQVVDVLALMGDASDNIPGVPGIGEKGAKGLVSEHGSLDAVLAAADGIKRKSYRESLKQNEHRARLSQELARIRTDAPVELDLDRLAVSEPDRKELGEIFTELEFRSLREKYGASAEEAPEAAPAEDGRDYLSLLDASGIESFVREAVGKREICLDTETTSANPMQAELVGISLSHTPLQAVYIPVGHAYLGAPEQPSWGTVDRLLRPLLADPAITKIGQNLKYDLTVLTRAGTEVAGPPFDTMIAAWVLDPSRRTYNLDSLAREYIDDRKLAFAEVAGKSGFQAVEIDRATVYSCTDADVTLRLAGELKGRLEGEGLLDLFESIEMPLVAVLADMEAAGVRIDVPYLTELSEEMRAEMEKITAEVMEMAGHDFNLDSPVQLRMVLFDELGLQPVGKTAKTKAFSTRDEDLEVLARTHPLPARVRDYRAVAKLRSTYVEALPKLVNPATGRVHTSFNQTGAASGRLSSSDPNLQNVPIRTELGRRVRRAFIPEKGWKLVCADYSQIELRILAHMCGDRDLIEAFKGGEDIHLRTAAQIFDVPYDKVTGEQRRAAKTINFGIIYGMSDFRLARELGITRTDAKRFIEAYFGRYSAVRQYIDDTIARVEESGEVKTLFGRRRRFPEVKSSNYNIRQQAVRAAVNTTIQGTAADLIKKAMVGLHRRLRSEGLAARMIIQVHDELVIETPKADTARVRELVREEMEGVGKGLKVPLLVEISEGESWLDAK